MSKILCCPEDSSTMAFISKGSRCVCGSNCFHYKEIDGAIAGYCNACGRLRGYPTNIPKGVWLPTEEMK